jgi:hypothetical protein
VEDSVDRIIAQWARVQPRMNVSAMGVLGRLSRLTRHFERDLQGVFSEHSLQPENSTSWRPCEERPPTRPA